MLKMQRKERQDWIMKYKLHVIAEGKDRGVRVQAESAQEAAGYYAGANELPETGWIAIEGGRREFKQVEIREHHLVGVPELPGHADVIH
jgi:hypothetical protein